MAALSHNQTEISGLVIVPDGMKIIKIQRQDNRNVIYYVIVPHSDKSCYLEPIWTATCIVELSGKSNGIIAFSSPAFGQVSFCHHIVSIVRLP
jgi:hypothetical protein